MEKTNSNKKIKWNTSMIRILTFIIALILTVYAIYQFRDSNNEQGYTAQCGPDTG